MTFRVELTETAKADSDDTYDWLDKRSPAGAMNWWQAFLDALESLKQNADSFGLAYESSAYAEEIRELVFKTRYGNTYRLVFCIRADTVYVLRVRAPGQPPLSREDIAFPK